MNLQKSNFLSINQIQDQYLKQPQKVQEEIPQVSFQDVLFKQQHLNFSKHAANRLSDRNIELTSPQVERLENGTVRAREKGIKESLVVVDELAFIVNVPNKTVVTVMGKDETQGNVFTNIDGAVFM